MKGKAAAAAGGQSSMPYLSAEIHPCSQRRATRSLNNKIHLDLPTTSCDEPKWPDIIPTFRTPMHTAACPRLPRRVASNTHHRLREAIQQLEAILHRRLVQERPTVTRRACTS